MNIHFNSPIGGTGYGNAALNMIKFLDHTKHNICLTSIGNPRPESEEDAILIRNCIKKQEDIVYDATTVKIWHQFDLLTKPGNGKYCAYPFFEIDTFNNLEKHHLNFPDLLITSSEWAKKVIYQNGVNNNVCVVPLGVDSSIFSPIIPEEKSKIVNYIFITIGKWEKRKGHDIVIECFNKAFSNSDNVELWMLTHNPFLNENQQKEWSQLVQLSKLKDKIKIFPRLSTQKEIASIISYADCGLYVSRAEGWNLELLETMAMDKPVIATNYSAHTEYCTKNNSYLIDIEELEPAIDNKWFFGEGNWASIKEHQIDQIVEHMRYVYKNQIKTNSAGIDTANKFTWYNTANSLLRCIE